MHDALKILSRRNNFSSPQRIILILIHMKKIQTCSVVWAVSTLNESTGKIMSKYSIQSLSSSSSHIKEQMWRHFVDSAISVVKSVSFCRRFYVLLCAFMCFYQFYQFCMYFYVSYICAALA